MQGVNKFVFLQLLEADHLLNYVIFISFLPNETFYIKNKNILQ